MPLSPALEEMFQEVIATIGGTLVDVELEESDLLICFKKAKRTFQQKGHNSYRRQFVPVQIVKGTNTYPVADDVDTIVKFITPGSGASFSSDDAFAILGYNSMFENVLFGGNGGFDQATYELYLQKIESLRRVMVTESQFHFDKFAKTVTLLKSPKANSTWFMECYANLTDDEYSKVDWIIRWTIAEAKHMLGMAYAKFQSLPGPMGEMSLNGSEYIQQSNQEKEQLLEDILNFVDGESDFMEIRFG
jgi:hypothetical protein